MKVVSIGDERYGKGRSIMERSTAGVSGPNGGNGFGQSGAPGRAEALAAMVREHREECALSQEEFARFAGVSRSTLSNIERGHLFPSGRIRRKLAGAMGVSPAKLWHLGAGEPHGSNPPVGEKGYEEAS